MVREESEGAVSQVIEGWYRNETRYRRVVVRDGPTVIQKVVDGEYVTDYWREQ